MTTFKKVLSAAAVAAVTLAAVPALADGPGASGRIQIPNQEVLVSTTVVNPLATGSLYAAPSAHVRRSINDRN
jgi:hypothetical protein